MARRHEPADEPADANLDELLGEVDLPTPTRRVRRWALRAVVQTFVVTLIVYTLARVVDLAPPFLLIASVAGGAVLVRLAAVSVKPPRGHRPTRLVATRPAEPPARRNTAFTTRIQAMSDDFKKPDVKTVSRLLKALS